MRGRSAVTMIGLLTLIALNVVAAPIVKDRFATPSYFAFSYDSVDGMDPSTQPVTWVREAMTASFGLYLAIGEHPGARVSAAPDVRLEPQYLSGFGQVAELRTLERTPSRLPAVGCAVERSGEDRHVGPYELCITHGEAIEVFRSGGVVVVQDSTTP